MSGEWRVVADFASCGLKVALVVGCCLLIADCRLLIANYRAEVLVLSIEIIESGI